MVFGRVKYIFIFNVFVNDCICVMILCGGFVKNLCKSVVLGESERAGEDDVNFGLTCL